MPLTSFSAEAFGLVTVALVCLLILLGLFCIYRSLYFQLRILRQGFIQLGYFNGPWITRILLVLVTIWWGFWEILRITVLKDKIRIFSNVTWQKNICKFYILSNFGFAEPTMFLTLLFLLHAALQKRESGALSHRWNRKAILYILFYCLPVLLVQIALVLVGPKFNEKTSGRTKVKKYFVNTSSMFQGSSVCTYPLFSTSFLGLFYLLAILYAGFVGKRLLSRVVNKGLRRRVYWLIFSIIPSLFLRVCFLGLSSFLHPGMAGFEATVFLAFCVLFFSATIGICMLVYCPVADALALRDAGHIDIEMPYDDYYHDGASLVANQSQLETGSFVDTRRNSDASTKHGSISFRTMIRDEPPPASEPAEEPSFHPAALHIASPSTPPLLVREVPRY